MSGQGPGTRVTKESPSPTVTAESSSGCVQGRAVGSATPPAPGVSPHVRTPASRTSMAQPTAEPSSAGIWGVAEESGGGHTRSRDGIEIADRDTMLTEVQAIVVAERAPSTCGPVATPATQEGVGCPSCISQPHLELSVHLYPDVRDPQPLQRGQ